MSYLLERRRGFTGPHDYFVLTSLCVVVQVWTSSWLARVHWLTAISLLSKWNNVILASCVEMHTSSKIMQGQCDNSNNPSSQEGTTLHRLQEVTSHHIPWEITHPYLLPWGNRTPMHGGASIVQMSEEVLRRTIHEATTWVVGSHSSLCGYLGPKSSGSLSSY